MIKQFCKKIEDNKEKIFGILAIILIILFAISITPKSLQNDTFYTVAIGKLIKENGIDMQDHFSWHEGLPYTYPHWLYDFGMYFIYNLGSWDGIYISTCVFAAILGISIYKVNSKLNKNPLVSFIVTIASLYLLKGYITARAQLVTFILFILLVYNIEKFVENKKIKNAVALFIIQTLIANLHVAVWPFTFVLYLPYIAEYLICELIETTLYRKVKLWSLKRKVKSINSKINNIKNNNQKSSEKNITFDVKNKKIKLEKIDIQYLENKLQKINEKIEEIEQRVAKIKIRRQENESKSYKVVMKKNSNVRWLILVMIITLVTGLLTPLGTTPYTYTILTMQGNTMDNINEHLPLTLINNIPIFCTIIIVLALMIFTKVKLRLSDWFIIGGLAYMMFASRRQSSMFVLIGSIVFTRMVTEFLKMYLDYPIEDIVKKCVNKYNVFLLATIVVCLSIHFYDEIKDDSYINEKTYPVNASEWILKNLDVNNIKLYNEYNYGSYLLYKGIPVFIDSRADLYAPEFNTPSNKANEGRDIFSDFINSSNIGTYYGDIFKKYNITHVLVGKSSKISMLIKKADSEKYKEIYSDSSFVIYEILEY